MGKLYTFYSYKGGVGRSMAMANVAALLSRWGYSVLAIDWDLEAPGLEKYFMKLPSEVSGSRADKPGVVDLVTAFAAGTPLQWEDCLLKAYPYGPDSAPVDILSAGQDIPDYVPNLQGIEWRRLFEQGFGAYLENLRDDWLNNYDFVLIDSRTGITDIGGVCTIHLPDVLVVFFTANEQSLNGVLDVMQRARAKYDLLPEEYERPPKLLGVPVPSRFEYFTEYESAARWLKKFADRLGDIYKEWLPEDTTPAEVLEKLFVPNIAFWSFGERLPVVQEGTSNPRSLGFSYDLLAKLLKHNLQWKDVLRGDEATSDESSPQLINERAERSFAGLKEQDKELARQVLLKMVVLSPTAGHESRQVVTLSEFETERLRHLINMLASEGILAVNNDDPSGKPSVQIAHDAILRSWKRLREWIDKDRDFLLWRQQIRARLAEWEKDESRTSYLLSGAALATAIEFVNQRQGELVAQEMRYIGQSILESAKLRRRARGRKVATFATILVIVLVSVLFGYRSYQKQQEAKQAELAFNRAVLATARGRDLFEEGDISAAIAVYDEAINQKSDYAAAYLNRGEAVLNLANVNPNEDERKKLTAQAIVDFQKAATLTTDDETRQQALQFMNDAQNPILPRIDATPTPFPTPTPGLTPAASPSATPIATPTPSVPVNITPRVYIQMRASPASLELEDQLRTGLKRMGYSVPPTEIVANVPATTEIRYYRKSDVKDAIQIMRLLEESVVGVRIKYLPGYENSTTVRPGHFEIWIGADVIGSGPVK